jgi:hypothetical protein
MDPITRQQTNQSTKSYIERELVISVGQNGPMVGASLDVMHTHHSHSTIESSCSDIDSTNKKSWFSFCSPDPQVDPRKYPQWKKNSIVFIIAVAGSV